MKLILRFSLKIEEMRSPNFDFIIFISNFPGLFLNANDNVRAKL